MRRADRLFQIVQYLRGGRLCTARSLAERLEVSERTIYRDIADLMATGVPIEGEAGVGYVMRAGFEMPPLMFSDEEVVALVAGARMIGAWGGAAMALAAKEAVVKIEAVLPDRLRARAGAVHVHALRLSEINPADQARIDQLEAACQARIRLSLSYQDASGTASKRQVRPLGLWFWGKAWTLVAWCELRDDFRAFRIDRIDQMQELDTFRPEPGKSMTAYIKQQACMHSDS